MVTTTFPHVGPYHCETLARPDLTLVEFSGNWCQESCSFRAGLQCAGHLHDSYQHCCMAIAWRTADAGRIVSFWPEITIQIMNTSPFMMTIVLYSSCCLVRFYHLVSHAGCWADKSMPKMKLTNKRQNNDICLKPKKEKRSRKDIKIR